jgi:hypothetical protein
MYVDTTAARAGANIKANAIIPIAGLKNLNGIVFPPLPVSV